MGGDGRTSGDRGLGVSRKGEKPGWKHNRDSGGTRKHQPPEVAAAPGTIHLVSAKSPRDEHRSRSLAGWGGPALALAVQRCPPFYHSHQVTQSHVSCPSIAAHATPLRHVGSIVTDSPRFSLFLLLSSAGITVSVHINIYILYACVRAKSPQSCPTR